MGSDEFDARRPAERQRQGCEQPQHMRGPDIHPTTKHSGTTDHVMHRLRPPFALLRWSFSPARALIQINRVIAFLGDALKADAHKEKRHCQSDRAQRDHSDGKQCLTYPVRAPALLDQRHDGDNQDRLRILADCPIRLYGRSDGPTAGTKHGPSDQQATFEIEDKVRQDRREETGGLDQPEGRLAAAEAGGLEHLKNLGRSYTEFTISFP